MNERATAVAGCLRVWRGCGTHPYSLLCTFCTTSKVQPAPELESEMNEAEGEGYTNRMHVNPHTPEQPAHARVRGLCAAVC